MPIRIQNYIRRRLALFLALCLLISIPAFAADSVTYDLSVNGENLYYAREDEIITVQFRIRSENGCLLTILQNEIEYDAQFFELVGNPETTKAGTAAADERTTHQKIVKYSMYSQYGENFTPDQEFGTFRLRVKGTSGSGTVRNSRTFAYDDAHAVGITQSDLTVLIAEQPAPSVTPVSTVTPAPSVTPVSTVTPAPSVTPVLTVTPAPSVTPVSTVTPVPSVTPVSTVTPAPSVTPVSTVTPAPSVTPVSTVTPAPSVTPVSTVTPAPSVTPVSTVTPAPSVTPVSTVTPAPSVTPVSTVTPAPSVTPVLTVTPAPSVTPVSTVTPAPSVTPVSTVTPAPSVTPVSTVTPVPSVTPVSTVTPAPSVTPVSTVTPAPSVTFMPTLTPTPALSRSSRNRRTYSINVAFPRTDNDTETIGQQEREDPPEPFLQEDVWENPFEDVSDEQYFYQAVQWALQNHITRGTTDTLFSPFNDCTRAQMVTFLWRSVNSPQPAGAAIPFVDVSPEQYYYNAVLWAWENGITNGTTETMFSPDVPVTRAQAVTFLYRMDGELSGFVNPFTDVNRNMYYFDAVLWAYEQGITTGNTDTTFAPDDPCLRCHIVTFLYRKFSNGR